MVFPWVVEQMLRQGLGVSEKTLGPREFPPPCLKIWDGVAGCRQRGIRRGSGAEVILGPWRGSLASSPQKRFGRRLACGCRGLREAEPGNLEQQLEEGKDCSAPWGAQKKLPQVDYPPGLSGATILEKGG